MTTQSKRVRFWMQKLEEGRVSVSVSKTLASRVFYAGCFFYASFFAHGYLVYDNKALAAADVSVAPVASAVVEPVEPLERGVTQSLLDAILRPASTGRPQ